MPLLATVYLTDVLPTVAIGMAFFTVGVAIGVLIVSGRKRVGRDAP